MCRRTEEEVVIIGNEMKNEAEVVPTYRKKNYKKKTKRKTILTS